MNRRLFFRVDANANIGRGHLSRCLAMANMLEDNFDISFLCLNENREYLKDLSLKFNVVLITDESEIFDIIGVDDFVCLDGYHFNEIYKNSLRRKIYKLIEINDIPYEAKNVDIIFNHTPCISEKDFGNINTQLYLGLNYAMLRPVFLDYAMTEKKIQDSGEGVFICFGGADTYNLGSRFVKNLIENNFDQSIYWVTNQSSSGFNFENVDILQQLSEKEMMAYMLKSKALIIPSSVLSIEAIALQKPSFTGYYVDNQKLIFEGLKKLDLAECYGYLETEADVKEATKLFLDFYNNSLRQEQIKISMQDIKINSKYLVLKALHSN